MLEYVTITEQEYESRINELNDKLKKEGTLLLCEVDVFRFGNLYFKGIEKPLTFESE